MTDMIRVFTLDEGCVPGVLRFIHHVNMGYLMKKSQRIHS